MGEGAGCGHCSNAGVLVGGVVPGLPYVASVSLGPVGCGHSMWGFSGHHGAGTGQVNGQPLAYSWFLSTAGTLLTVSRIAVTLALCHRPVLFRRMIVKSF